MSFSPRVFLAALGIVACPVVLGSQPPGDVRPAALPVTASLRMQEPLRPGDVVRVRIWREQDLSGEFVVDEDGMAVFPNLGPLHVTTFGPDSLRAVLVMRYAESLRTPSIEVRLLRRVRVLGAVRSPGLYQIDATMTMGDVLAMAGGTTGEAARGRVDVVRDGRRVRQRLDDAALVGATRIRSGDQLIVPERGWWHRNATTAISVGTSLVGLLVTIIVFGND